ncbi:hypothetical protein MLD38_033673 [Melastoma candidum]|uniref:Uncharacterized protein n=1 Tax=Melastoma candidum TaxID=119954 RepID=A0ACB9M7I4_9MYRT|nr:hypothetical protein MLD38_033673 [Melastoma candidum]
MPPRKPNMPKPSISSLLLFAAASAVLLLSTSVFFLLRNGRPLSPPPLPSLPGGINVYVSPLPRSLNYGLLNSYFSSPFPDSRLPSASSDPDWNRPVSPDLPPYPENPLIKQYSAEYWILGDLETPEGMRSDSFVKRVWDEVAADVVFVPFFATLSAEMQLRGKDTKDRFRKKDGNEDYARQRQVMDFLKGTERWRQSGGRDHVFVLTDPVAMWHVRDEISQSVLLVVDFGGWYKQDSKSSDGSSVEKIQHTQVSLLKDVIVPYTHLLPRLDLSQNQKRHNLLYFKGAKHRHRGGVVREKLWDMLVNVPGVVMEEGFPNATGKEQSIRGMRGSDFCLHPAGDTPTSCRLFDAIQSLCIPVVVSDNIELPFEGMLDYTEFSVFVSSADALTPNWLVNHLKSFSEGRKEKFRQGVTRVQSVFEYDSGHPGGIGPIPSDGAINYIWRKVSQKLPMIKEAITRDKRKPPGVTIPIRCQCT